MLNALIEILNCNNKHNDESWKTMVFPNVVRGLPVRRII